MKLIIQIPCYNEEETLPETVADLPTQIDGIDTIEYLIIDDGSADRTSEVAREVGVHHIVRFADNRGLARGFMAGLDACLKLGADIVVNTDADNQYKGQDIPKLVRPLIDGEADIVVGDRQVMTIEHFSATKKQLQKFGSWVVRQASATTVVDATSGFRAISRDAAMRMFVVNEFTYTLETLIQAGRNRLEVASVPIGTNPKTRESRLFKSIPDYINRAGSTIVRIYTMYKPLRTFFTIAAICLIIATAIGGRFLYFFINGEGDGHVQSLLLATILFNAGFVTLMVGILADLVAANRKLMEDAVTRLRRIEFDRDPVTGPPVNIDQTQHRASTHEE